MLLLEAWSQSPDSQFPFQGKGRERFLGECRFYGAMLRNPPSGRFDIPLRPRSGRALEKQNYVGGKLSVQMVPRQSAWQPEDDATQSQRLWTEYIERETNRRKSEEARRTERSNGEKSRTLICLCIEEATGLPLNVVKPWIEIFYNRKRVGLFQAITEECSKQVVSARWNVSLEMTSDDSTVAALNDVWPEIRFKLWRQASSDPVERRGFLGVAIVRGSKSAITQPPLRKAYPPAGHRQKLRLEARENVAADSTESFAGELSVTICTFTEQSFEDTVSSWGINDLPLPGLAFQVFGTKNGCSLSEAFAEIQVDKFSVARSDTQSVDLMRRRLWENADFILPIPSEKLPTRVEVSVNGTGNKVGLLNEKAKTTEKSFKQSKHVMRNLGHSSIVFTSEQTTPYTTEHLLRAKGNRVHSKRMPESKRLQVEGEQYLAEPPIDVDDGPCSLRESAEFAESDFGILLTRTCRKRAWKPPLGTPSARKHSQARLRLTIYGVSNGSHLGSISGSSRTGNVDDGWSFAARYVADERSPTMFESSRGASFLILSPPSNFTGEGELDDSTKRDTREALISLPNTWDAQWQRGHGALLIEIRHHDVTVGYCHVGPDALARVPRHFGQVSISALELKGRFAPSRIRPGCSRFCSRLLQPFATDQKSMLPVRVLQTRIHFQLGLEEITKSDASKLTSIPCCTPSGCVSRLRLLVLGTTELEGSLLNRTLVSVEWSNQLVGTCELGTMSGIGCSSMSRRLFLLPFGNGCVGCPRDGDSLVLRLRSERKSADKVASRVASIRLGWQELKHLNSVRTDFLVSTPCSDSLGNALETVPVELEMLNDRCNSTVCSDLPGHAGVSCAKASISISLVVEESRASVEHILSVQSCSFRDLADTRNSRAPWEGGSRLCASPRHAVGATRMLGGSKDRWLFMNLQLNERVATTPTTHVKEDVFDARRMNRQIVPFTTKQITRLPLPTERPKCNPCEVSLALFDAGEPNLHQWRNSIIVQSYVRRFLAFLVLLRLRDKMMDDERRTRAAELVQEFARLASIRWREKRQMLSIERATLLAVAAIRIQRIWYVYFLMLFD